MDPPNLTQVISYEGGQSRVLWLGLVYSLFVLLLMFLTNCSSAVKNGGRNGIYH
jgi:hypothetical protein